MTTQPFEADTGRVLNIVINSLYSEKEIFLRELISNSSDAVDKRRFQKLTGKSDQSDSVEYEIQLEVSSKDQILSIRDNGIGMDESDLVSSLGTIAKSGTTEFLAQLEASKQNDKAKSVNLIGQFGVGFYSAFMVADKVEVISKKEGSSKAFKWHSDGISGFEISDVNREEIGTTVNLFIKKSEKDYLKRDRLVEIVKKYSDHIQYPIRFIDGKSKDKDTLNDASAIWMKSKSEISKEQYDEFFVQSGGGFGKPLITMHNKAEGVISYTSLMYIPEMRPFDLFHVDRSSKVKLYANRVFITDTLDNVLPRWLRFINGVLDTSDLNLNVSREMLQHSPALRRISKAVKKKIITELKKKKDKDEEVYNKVWKEFGAVLKEGIYEDPDHKLDLLGLSKFKSSKNEDEKFLPQYVEGMHKKQTQIFYIAADSLEQATKSPHLEAFKSKGIEVLFFTDPIDTFWLSTQDEFDGKKFVSITQGSIDLSDFDEKGSDKKDKDQSSKFKDLTEGIKAALGDSVSDVRVSAKLIDSACCLVASDSGMDVQMERIMKMQNQDFKGMPRILEINPNHSLIAFMAKLLTSNKESFDDLSKIVLDQARLLEGHLPDDVSFYCKKINELITRDVKVS
ncbi:MAG: molecular chaperone HtpG [Rhodobacteraceae bacterium]|nr:MAG: molecular chaperone HtpG [Paracoccaceae bacterium]